MNFLGKEGAPGLNPGETVFVLFVVFFFFPLLVSFPFTCY